MRVSGRQWIVPRKKSPNPVRHAEEPGQTINVDLCFVPMRHEVRGKLPAVSGSSGRLIVGRSGQEAEEREWPGQVFADASRDYAQVMLEYVARSQADGREATSLPTAAQKDQQPSVASQKRALRIAEDQLRVKRRTLRQQRAEEDAAWKALRAKRRQEKVSAKNRTASQRQAQQRLWETLRDQRRLIRQQREQEDDIWREQRRHLREQLSQLPLVTAWIAILVITDNCTRQALGLPLFVAGSSVTAEMVVDALRVLLPPELQFLISDRGTHFTANVFAQLAEAEQFVHVVIARHRPQSNGIAERFVRTLKEWLRDKSWQDDAVLAQPLEIFLQEYNNRPHQGLPIPGLSPNEFEKRMWLM